MTRSRNELWILWSAVAVQACAAKASPTTRLDVRALEDGCALAIEDQTFKLPSQHRAAIAFLREGRRMERTYTFAQGTEVPYRCIGAAIYLLQEAGVRRVGFISEPPPP